MSNQLLPLWRIEGFDLPSVLVFQDTRSYEKCPLCGVSIEEFSYENNHMRVGPGRRWPDVLSSIDHVVVHERVVDELHDRGFAGYIAHPVRIDEVKGNNLEATTAPKYFILEVTGRVEVDWNSLDENGGSVCPGCLYRKPKSDCPYRWKVKNVVPLMETWDQSDFVKFSNLRASWVFCSRRFIDLAHKHRWTNFKFGYDVPGIGLWERPQKGINGLSYHRSDWYERALERYEEKMRTADEKSLD